MCSEQRRLNIKTLVLPSVPKPRWEACPSCKHYNAGDPACEATNYWWGDFCMLDNFKGPHDWRTDVDRPCPDYEFASHCYTRQAWIQKELGRSRG